MQISHLTESGMDVVADNRQLDIWLSSYCEVDMSQESCRSTLHWLHCDCCSILLHKVINTVKNVYLSFKNIKLQKCR